MSVPPDKLMELMRGSQAAAGAPTPNEMPEEMDTELPEAPPMASPMSTPEPKMGNKEAALINISMAIDLLEQSLPAFGSISDEGKKTLNAIRVLSGLIGQKKARLTNYSNQKFFSCCKPCHRRVVLPLKAEQWLKHLSLVCRHKAVCLLLPQCKENQMELFKPRGAAAPRRPTDNNQQNGVVTNTPVFLSLVA